MILVDINQIMYSAALPILTDKKHKSDLSIDLVRHVVINILRSVNVKYRSTWGKLVIADDSRNYWRKRIFPFYKSGRKKARQAIDIDWPMFFEFITQVKQELQQFFPYKYIVVDQAEADDVIATLVFNRTEPILIISSDKDYAQLHANDVQQYDPIRTRMLNCENPAEQLVEHIFRGDASDGIPNIASADNSFVMGIRQNKVTKGIMEQQQQIISDNQHKLHRNYQRNKMLIDLTMIPQNIQQQIIDKYEQTVPVDRTALLNYFIANKLKQHMININVF